MELWPWLLLALLIIFGIWFVRASLVVLTVEQTSMAPAFDNGDRLLVCRCWLRNWLRKDQGVVLRAGDLPLDALRAAGRAAAPGRSAAAARAASERPEALLIKRIVALEGETVRATAPEQDGALREWTIPPRHIFVCGDSAACSLDSRHWVPVPQRAIWGLVVLKLPARAPRKAVETLRAAGWGGLLLGQPAPPFRAQTLLGGQATPATYAARPLVLIFVAPEAATSRELLAAYSAAHAQRPAGLQLVAVSVGPPAATAALAAGLVLALPLLVAPREDNLMARDYCVAETPSFCVIDARGSVRAQGPTPADYEALLRAAEVFADVELAT